MIMERIKQFFATIILLLLCSTMASAHHFEVDGIYYNITDEAAKTVVVTYKGSYSGAYDDEYSGAVVIPQTVTYNSKTYSVTSIRKGAFISCSGLTSITIPNSVTSIGESAFYYCTGLASVTIGNGVISIEKWAFLGCSSLKSISIPGNVKSIDWAAFYNCTGLKHVDITDGVTSIGEEAFSGCAGIESLYISNSIENIGDNAFAGCNNILDIKVGSKKAIVANENIFSTDAYNNACLYVPTGRKFAYERNAPWNKFYIVETDFTVITEISPDDAEPLGNGAIYDLYGRPVKEPAKGGIYIIDGKKVVL